MPKQTKAVSSTIAKLKEIFDEIMTSFSKGAKQEKKDEAWDKHVEDIEKALGGLTKGKRTKKAKDPDAPKKPLTAYFRYQAEVRDKVTTELKEEMGDDFKQAEVAKKIGAMWKKLSDAKKAKYKPSEKEMKAYKAAKAKYDAKHGGGDDEDPKPKKAKKPKKEVEEETAEDEEPAEEEPAEEEEEEKPKPKKAKKPKKEEEPAEESEEHEESDHEESDHEDAEESEHEESEPEEEQETSQGNKLGKQVS